MASVLLIRPLCSYEELEMAEPLGIERLAGFLCDGGEHDVVLFDRRLIAAERQAGQSGGLQEGTYASLRACYGTGGRPDIIGLSLMTSDDVPDALRIISRLRAWWPQALFVAGGLYVTTDPEGASRRFPSHVMLLRGEGEMQLLELARSVSAGHEPSQLSALPEEVGILCPNQWALPYRPDMVRYARLGCAVNVQSSRGCHGSCAFCATPRMPGGLRCWSPRSMTAVVDELQIEAVRLCEAGLPPVFNFVDDDFGPLSRLEELAGELDARDLRISYACELRYASLAGQTDLCGRLARLRKLGLTRLFFGVESLDSNTLARWNKPLDLTGLPIVLDACRNAGIAVQVGYILWHARQTVQGAFDEVKRLYDFGIYTHKAALGRLIAFPGCALDSSDVDASGFQRMGESSERFYRRFAEESADITVKWTKAAIAEPSAVAEAHLGWDRARCQAIREELEDLNEQSYELFTDMVARYAQDNREDEGPR